MPEKIEDKQNFTCKQSGCFVKLLPIKFEPPDGKTVNVPGWDKEENHVC